MSKKSRLGRSLDILLSQTKSLDQTNKSDEIKQDSNYDHVINMPIEALQVGQFQPRKYFDETALLELSNSIKAQGIIQPLIVRVLNDAVAGAAQYEIIAGERRWRAAQLAQCHKVPVIIKEISDQEALAISIIENIQREDLNAIEEAQALAQLINQFELTHQETGDLVGRSRSAISNLLRLLDLFQPVQEMLVLKKIEMGHARALLALVGQDQLEIANLIILRGLSVRETENLIRNQKTANLPNSPKLTQVDPNISALERKLSETLGSKVSFKHQTSGQGQILIKYHSLEELDGIISKIK
ncbi:chromosome partitioning protein ParB [Gammaproteobacteria bacterium]|nr:chromosome partitioning protein ParB [Gammaproteobacteria bacterium]